MSFRIKSLEPVDNIIRGLRPAIRRGMERGFIDVEAHVKGHKLSGQVLKVRSGRLRRSITHRVSGRGSKISGKVGTNVVYAPMHEFGETIRPKKGKYLTIPLPAALTPAGVLRGGARSFPNTFIRTTKSGNTLIFQKREKTILPLFVLKKQVRIPERPFMRPSLDEKLPDILRYVGNELEKL